MNVGRSEGTRLSGDKADLLKGGGARLGRGTPWVDCQSDGWTQGVPPVARP
jgi:hypothetical protein